MNEIVEPNDLVVPSGLDRQKLFYLLKKVSSITAWRRIYAYYKAWADVTKASLQEATRHGWALTTSLPASELEFVQGGLDEFRKAMAILEKGHCRKIGDPPFMELIAARKRLTIQLSVQQRVDDGENGVNEEHTPLWQEYCDAMHCAYDVWQECSMHLFQRDYFPSGMWYYNRWLKNDVPLMHFPDKMEAVPDPALNRLVRANGFVPCAGIWEPVAAPATRFVDRFTGAWKPAPPFRVVGPMKYFDRGAQANGITLQHNSDSDDAGEKLHLAWRLLWQEDRYADGTVPEEEAHYRFLEPERSRPKTSGIEPPDGVIWAWSGAAAPVSGQWLLESHGSFTQMRKKGQRMAFSQWQSVRWVLLKPDCHPGAPDAGQQPVAQGGQ